MNVSIYTSTMDPSWLLDMDISLGFVYNFNEDHRISQFSMNWMNYLQKNHLRTLWWTNIAMENRHFYWENPL